MNSPAVLWAPALAAAAVLCSFLPSLWGCFPAELVSTCNFHFAAEIEHSPASVFGLPLGSLACFFAEECGFAEASCSLPLAPASFPLPSGSSESESESSSSSSAFFSLTGAVPTGSFFLGSAGGELAGGFAAVAADIVAEVVDRVLDRDAEVEGSGWWAGVKAEWFLVVLKRLKMLYWNGKKTRRFWCSIDDDNDDEDDEDD
jgi:hypothetical protein